MNPRTQQYNRLIEIDSGLVKMFFGQDDTICGASDRIAQVTSSIEACYCDHVYQQQIFGIAQDLFLKVKFGVGIGEITDHVEISLVGVWESES